MPAFDFPDNPAVGDQAPGAGGITYVWDGSKWANGTVIATGGGSQWTDVPGGGIYYSGGDVGIGRVPEAMLDVGGTLLLRPTVLQNASGGEGLRIGVDSTGAYADILSYNWTTQQFVPLNIRGNPSYFTGGPVGIGTATPASVNTLQVHVGVDENFGVSGPVAIGSAVCIQTANDAWSANTPLEIRASATTFSVGSVACYSTLSCSSTFTAGGDVHCNNVHANGNVLYMGGDAVYMSWDGSNMVTNRSIYCTSNIQAAGNLYANSNWLYFASGAVAVYWDGTWIHHTHNIYTDQSIQAVGTITASGTMSANGNVYYMANNGVYMTWNGNIAFSHNIAPPSITTPWIAVGGAGAVGNSVNVTGNYYINGAVLQTGITGVTWQQNEVNMAFRPTCDFRQVTNIVFYVTDDPGSNRVQVYATQVSDERLKENIVPLEGGMSVIRQLRPVEFDFNGLGGTRKGLHCVSLLAQELQPISPKYVTSIEHKLRPSDEQTTSLLTFDTNVIIYQTVLAVQELEKRLEILEKRN